MIEVLVRQDFAFDGNVHQEGDVVGLPDDMAEALVGSGHASRVDSEDDETPESGVVDEALDKGLIEHEGSGWYTILETGEKVQGKDAVREALGE